MRRLSAARWLAAWLIVLSVATMCQGQGLAADKAGLVAASAAANSFAKELDKAEQFKKQAAADPTKACNANNPDSLCAKQSSEADAAALLVATAPLNYDLRDPKQTGGIKVVTPVLEQGECNTCTAFAVGAAAETALAIGLRKPATHWFSQQDFFFCNSLENGQIRTCRSTWVVEQALGSLSKNPPVTPTCMPYDPLAKDTCVSTCNTVNPDVPTGKFEHVRLTNPADMQQWIRTHGPVLTSMALYKKDLFTFLAKTPSGIYKGPASPTQEAFEGHAVVLVGYNTDKRFWVVRSSWGPKVGVDGYIYVAYGAVGIAEPQKTYGLRFTPLKPTAPYAPEQLTPTTPKGCYNYKASAGDYFGRVAEIFGVPVKQLLAANLQPGQNMAAPLTGKTLLVCNSKEVANVLPPTSQAQALLRIKSAVDRDGQVLNWALEADSKPKAYCEWNGVECDAAGNVLKISLEQYKQDSIKGVLPDVEALLALPKLTVLELTNQKLAGTLPASYGKLTNLVQLDFSNNELQGTLPASWAGMKSLQVLFLGSNDDQDGNAQGNQLEGPLPAEWGSMAKLSKLGLVNNMLDGPLPASWGALRLVTLQLNDNQLTGSLPASWAPLVAKGRLSTLDVSNNQLSGELPASWGPSQSVTEFVMHNNQFTGPIPSSWAATPTLRDADFSNNKLTGAVPNPWSKTLSTLHLANNAFSGPLPVWAAPGLTVFETGYYDNNKFTGANKFTGPIPANLPKLMPALQTLQIPCSQLSGPLPAELGELSNLQQLDVSSNPGIKGLLPASLGKLTSLTMLDVADTGISGSIPASFVDLTSLETFSVARTALTGCVPAGMSSIKAIWIDNIVDDTKITGYCK